MSANTSETVLVLSCAEDAVARRNLEDFSVLLCEQARMRGCKAHALWADGTLKIRMQSACAESLNDILDSLTTSAAEQGATIAIGQDQEFTPSIRDLEEGPIPWGAVVRAKLTRELLETLPEGAFVAADSTCGRGSAVGLLGPIDRDRQWQRIRSAGLEGEMCRVFWSKEEYEAFVGSESTDDARDLSTTSFSSNAQVA